MVGGNLSLVDQLSGMQLVSCQILDETQQSFVGKRLKCLHACIDSYSDFYNFRTGTKDFEDC